MRVPFLDLARQNVALRDELTAAFVRVMESGRVLYGAELEAFENELAAWFGVKYAIGVASGTDAVEIALRATGIGPGDVVACPAFTAVPCANAIEATGATLSLLDVDETSGNWEQREGAPMPAGRGPNALLQVSLFGRPVRPPGEGGWSPVVVEDIAHSMGAEWWETKLGTFRSAGAVSMYPTKNLGALGDGGAVITNDTALAERVRALRHYGFDGDNVRSRGQNSRLSEVQAAFLRVKLPHVHGWNERRRQIAARYNAELTNVTCWRESPRTKSAPHVYVIRHPERDRIKADLEARGIGTMIHYPRAIHQHERWRHLGEPGQFPASEAWARECLSLPCYPELREDEQDAVIAAMKAATRCQSSQRSMCRK